MSLHAIQRQQQRCIPPLIIEWLHTYGDEQHDKHGCVIRYFSKESKKQLSRRVGKVVVGLLGRFMDTYLVESNDGDTITVGHRYKKINAH